jgi:hypothetical protein
VTALLAMLYLVLISTLAVGFYASTTTQSQVAANEEKVAKAYFAAESGMDFMRRAMARVSVDSSAGQPGHQSIAKELYDDLKPMLESQRNLGGKTVELVGNPTPNIIHIPSVGSICLNAASGAGFKATITDLGGGTVACKVDGYYGDAVSGGSTAARAIQMGYSREERDPKDFDFAVVTKGSILMKKGAVQAAPSADSKIASMMSAQTSGYSITVTGGIIGGDLTIVDPDTTNAAVGANVAFSGGSVGGSSISSVVLSQHVHDVATAPELPTFDPTIYKPYATNDYKVGAPVQQNIIIKAGTNPTFNANDTVRGIMYVESPNRVTLNGDFKLQGFIVMETGSAPANAGDALTFKGNVTMSPVPNSPAFDTVRSASGVAIMAPSAAISMTGSTDSYVKGSIICKSFNFAGSADMLVDHGTIMTVGDTGGSAIFQGKVIQFTATGADNMPKQGVSYSAYFKPDTDTYAEVLP